jgi:hypothetical protein
MPGTVGDRDLAEVVPGSRRRSKKVCLIHREFLIYAGAFGTTF